MNKICIYIFNGILLDSMDMMGRQKISTISPALTKKSIRVAFLLYFFLFYGILENTKHFFSIRLCCEAIQY